jgi:hypothetical protein
LETNTVDVRKKEEIEVQIHKEYKERKERRIEYKYSRRTSQKGMKKMSSDHKSRGRDGKGNEKIDDVELGLETSLNSKYWSEGHKVQCMN